MDQFVGTSSSTSSSSSSEGFSSSDSLSSSSSSSVSSSSSSSGRSSSSTTTSGSSSSSNEAIGTSGVGGAHTNVAWDDKAGGSDSKRKEDGEHVLRNDRIVFDVFISDPFCPDIDLFRLWTIGTEEKRVPDNYKMQKGGKPGAGSGTGSDTDGSLMSLSSGLGPERRSSFIRAHIRHQFHLFRLVAEKLQRPNSLKSRIEINIARKDQSDLIKLYYAFDDSFVRELVGKRISSGVRKTLDDIAKDAQVPFSSCLRQFDNIKRVYKFAVEPYTGQVLLVGRICDEFRMHTKMATRYVVTSFIAEYKPTFDKRLQGCPYKTIEQLVLATIKAWTNGLTLDFTFSVAAMRDAKKHVKKVDAKYCEDVQRRLGGEVPKGLTDEKHFKAVVKAVGMLLDDTSELTSFGNFYEVVYKFCESHFWAVCSSKDQISSFFDALIMCSPEFVKPDEGTAWKTYLSGIRDLSIIFYDLPRKRN